MSLFLKLSPSSSKTVSMNCWGIRTCIHPANLPLSVYYLLVQLFSRKCVVPSNPRGAIISSSVVSLVELPMYRSSISGLCMFFILLLTVRVHSESSFWIDFWWSVRAQSAHGLFFFVLLFLIVLHVAYFPYFFLLFISSVFLLGLGSALMQSELAVILTNGYCRYIPLAAGRNTKGSCASSCLTWPFTELLSLTTRKATRVRSLLY